MCLGESCSRSILKGILTIHCALFNLPTLHTLLQVSCIGATLAFYVPYDFSFYKGMASLESYALRYSAPLLALVIVPIAARVRYTTCNVCLSVLQKLASVSLFHINIQYTKLMLKFLAVLFLVWICRRHRFKYWHSIWTITLLMYVMTVETSVSLLFCPILNSTSMGSISVSTTSK